MPLLSKCPKSQCCDIFSSWTVLKDLVKLDGAFCNVEQRQLLFGILAIQAFSLPSGFVGSERSLFWLQQRGISITSLEIKSDNTLRLCGFKIHSTIIFNTSRVETLILSNITSSLENYLSLIKLIDSCRVLKILKFRGVPALNDEFFDMIQHGLFNQVISLEITNSGEEFSEMSMNCIAKYCFRLEEFIFITENDLITEENLLEVIRANKGLKTLKVNFNQTDSACTDRILGTIARSSQHLEVLQLEGKCHLSSTAVTNVITKLTKTLQSFKYSNVYTLVNPNPNQQVYNNSVKCEMTRTAMFQFEQDDLVETRHLTMKGTCFTDSPIERYQNHYHYVQPGTTDDHLKIVFKALTGLTHLTIQRMHLSDFLVTELIVKLNSHLQRLYMCHCYEVAQCHTPEVLFLKIPQLITFIQVPTDVDPNQYNHYGHGHQPPGYKKADPIEFRNPALPPLVPVELVEPLL